MDEQSGNLIGVVNFHHNNRAIGDPHRRIDLQAYANIRAHFDWISEITGMVLPKCGDTFDVHYRDWLAKFH